MTKATATAARSEDPAPYNVTPIKGDEPSDRFKDDVTIAHALGILAARLRVPGACMDSPRAVKDYLVLQLAELPREVFGCVFLDAQNCAIKTEQLFAGSLTQTSVYPREVVKAALAANAAAVILFHNHPSGKAEPSRADDFLTATLKGALALIDVRILDHIVVGGTTTVSFAERGLL